MLHVGNIQKVHKRNINTVNLLPLAVLEFSSHYMQ